MVYCCWWGCSLRDLEPLYHPAIRDHEKKVADLADYVSERKGQLDMMRESNDNEQISRHQMLSQEHDMFSSAGV
jgi:hypothetical protein